MGKKIQAVHGVIQISWENSQNKGAGGGIFFLIEPLGQLIKQTTLGVSANQYHN